MYILGHLSRVGVFVQLRKLLAVVLLCGGCASPTPGGAGVSSRNRGVLVSAEIAQSSGVTAYDVLAQLRPEYLRSRGQSSLTDTGPATAVVYIDNVLMGSLSALRNLDAQAMSRVEYLNASDATTRFGTDHNGGAILVFTKR